MDKKLKFVGCDDPAGFMAELDAKRARKDAARERNWKKELAYIESVDAGRTAPWKSTPDAWPSTWPGDRLFRSEASWKAYRDARPAEIGAALGRLKSRQEFRSMPFGDMIHQMPGAKIFDAPSDGDADAFVARTERELGLRLAPDYIAYIRAFGRVSIGSVELSGYDPSGEHDTASSTLIIRAMLRPLGGVGDKYYLLGGVDSDRVPQLAYFQDGDGYVYELTEDGKFSVQFRSLRDYLAEMWVCVEEGAM